MKVDFIHVGLHKCASTWLQKGIFPKIQGLLICNDARLDLERAFFDPFILCDPFHFDANAFRHEFEAKVRARCGEPGKFRIVGISEENLSGDVLNGKEARTLADRLREVFDGAKILIVIRNQLDMLLSIYSNYITHGGTGSLAQMAGDLNLEGMRVFHKLTYSGLIAHYQHLFGQRNVHVEVFEKMVADSVPLQRFFQQFGLDDELPRAERRKINPGRSLLANGWARHLNRFGINGSALAGIVDIDRRESDRARVRRLFPAALEQWRSDNRLLREQLGVDLTTDYEL